MPQSARISRWLGIALLVIGYPVLAHYTNENVQNGKLGAVVAITPVLVVSLVFAWKASPRWAWLTLFVAAFVAVAASWRLLERHFGLVYWIQDAGMQAILFMTFARTLLAGRKPLCTHFAEMAHGDITPQHAQYAGQVTWAWTIFFALMVIVSTGLFFLTPLPVWSVFANFLTLPLVVLMFALEFLVRRMLLPEMRTSGFFDAFRISWKSLRHSGARAQLPERKA
ncbi:MAG: hypothetical protein Q7K57_24835 [Burkholderiaceae bacterium]|nr:hypothetical protein [Burkholderiaceae bacterium]